MFCEKSTKIVSLPSFSNNEEPEKYLVFSDEDDTVCLVCCDKAGYTIIVPYRITPVNEGDAKIGALLWAL